jgi:hypothetical protein
MLSLMYEGVDITDLLPLPAHPHCHHYCKYLEPCVSAFQEQIWYGKKA